MCRIGPWDRFRLTTFAQPARWGRGFDSLRSLNQRGVGGVRRGVRSSAEGLCRWLRSGARRQPSAASRNHVCAGFAGSVVSTYCARSTSGARSGGFDSLRSLNQRDEVGGFDSLRSLNRRGVGGVCCGVRSSAEGLCRWLRSGARRQPSAASRNHVCAGFVGSVVSTHYVRSTNEMRSVVSAWCARSTNEMRSVVSAWCARSTNEMRSVVSAWCVRSISPGSAG